MRPNGDWARVEVASARIDIMKAVMMVVVARGFVGPQIDGACSYFKSI